MIGHFDESTFLDGPRDRAERARDRVALGHQGQRRGGVGQRESSFGQTDELDRSRGRVGEHQAHRVGQPDVLAREDDESSRKESRALAALEHRDEPVQRAVGVRSAHRLDEGADLVEVRIA